MTKQDDTIMKMGLAKSFALGFTILYIAIFGLFLYSSADTEARNVDKRCATYISDGQIEVQPGIMAEAHHYEDRNELCYFYYWYLMPIVWIVAIGPFLAIVMLPCGLSGACTAPIFYAVGAIAVIANALLCAAIGYGIGSITSRMFGRRNQHIR